MSAEPDRSAFDTASKPATATSTGFADIARMAASVDTLDGFLREMRTRFPDATARAPLSPGTVKADPFPTGSLPAIVGLKRVPASSTSAPRPGNLQAIHPNNTRRHSTLPPITDQQEIPFT